MWTNEPFSLTQFVIAQLRATSLTQAAIGRRIGIDQTTVSRWMRAKATRTPDCDSIDRILAEFPEIRRALGHALLGADDTL